MISDPQELYRFLATPGIGVANLLFASDVVFWASWRYTDEENIPSVRHTNEVIGAFVTAGASLHLYVFWTDCRRKTCTATPIVCFTYVTTNRR
jgi:hypothetical protein